MIYRTDLILLSSTNSSSFHHSCMASSVYNCPRTKLGRGPHQHIQTTLIAFPFPCYGHPRPLNPPPKELPSAGIQIRISSAHVTGHNGFSRQRSAQVRLLRTAEFEHGQVLSSPSSTLAQNHLVPHSAVQGEIGRGR